MDLDTLEKVMTLCKTHGVTSLKWEGVELTLPAPPQTVQLALPVDEPTEPGEKPRDLYDDPMLYRSAGGAS